MHFRKGDPLTTKKAINELMRPNIGLLLNCKLFHIVWYKKEEEIKAEESSLHGIGFWIFSSGHIIIYFNKQKTLHATIETYIKTLFLPKTAVAWRYKSSEFHLAKHKLKSSISEDLYFQLPARTFGYSKDTRTESGPKKTVFSCNHVDLGCVTFTVASFRPAQKWQVSENYITRKFSSFWGHEQGQVCRAFRTEL